MNDRDVALRYAYIVTISYGVGGSTYSDSRRSPALLLAYMYIYIYRLRRFVGRFVGICASARLKRLKKLENNREGIR
jgi:hypothetical protein